MLMCFFVLVEELALYRARGIKFVFRMSRRKEVEKVGKDFKCCGMQEIVVLEGSGRG